MNFLEARVDKFVFRLPDDRHYTDTDLWVKREGQRVRIGLTDFLQQRSGDVAFVNSQKIGALLSLNSELAEIETIKVTFVVPSPLRGRIGSVNAALEEHPELVNNDPYGAGWLVEIEPEDDASIDALMGARDYLPRMVERAREEAGA